MKIRQRLSLGELLDVVREHSRGGHPDDFIPDEALIRGVRGGVEIYWYDPPRAGPKEKADPKVEKALPRK